MHKRTAHRWRLGAIMTTGLMFTLGSFWLLQVIHQGENEVRADPRQNEPDYIVDQFSVVRMSPKGEPSYIMAGKKLTHRPIDDSSEIETPHVQGLSPGMPTTDIVAKTARVDHNNSQVHLLGGVVIERPASSKSKAMLVKTEEMTLFPDDEQMRTDKPFSMDSGSAKITGTGMFADNATGAWTVEKNVLIVYPPPGKR